MKRIMLISAAVLALAGCTSVPQLGKDSIDKVLKAMTLEEKVHFVIGTGMAGANGESAVVGATKKIVPGAAGTTYPIERLGIPSIVLATAPPASASTRPAKATRTPTTARTSPSAPSWPRPGTRNWWRAWARRWVKRFTSTAPTSISRRP